MIKSPPLDVANMIALLRKGEGCNIRLFDLRVHNIAQDSFWAKKGIDLNVFNDFQRCFNHVLEKESSEIGRLAEKILNETELNNIKFLVFFITVIEQFSLQYFVSALCIAARLKKTNHPIKIIFSGNCPKRYIRRIMRSFHFLDAFLEDGNEYALLEYVKKAGKGKTLRGVIYREADKLISPVANLPLQLNRYPVPDFSLFDLEKYKSTGRLALPYELSRGCVNNCFFCYYIYKGGKIYKKSYAKAVKELIYLKNKYHADRFHFIDAEINFDKNYLRKFCQELLAKKAEILWSALAIPADLDPDLLGLMRKSGCVQLRFGVESGGPGLLRKINKNTNAVEMSRVLKDAHQIGIYTYVTLIGGLPPEEVEDILATKAFLKRNKEYIDSVSICDYGELGHFGIYVLENLLNQREHVQESARAGLSGRPLRVYAKKIGLKEEDIIDGFLCKI